MFFPFVGLTLAVIWGVRLAFLRKPSWRRAAAAGAVAVIVVAAVGTHVRNRVWRTEETLWADVVEKSPRNGRGLMNYGLIFLPRGDYATALSYFERARPLTPNYWSLEVNLGVAKAGLNRAFEAEQHFQRAIALAPGLADPLFFYGRWLRLVGRRQEAADRLEAALRLNPFAFDSRHLLLDVYASLNNWAQLDRLVDETLALSPNDPEARRFQAARFGRAGELAAAERAALERPTPEAYLDLSHLYYQVGRFHECINAAKRALKLRPDYAEAYRNLAAAYNSIERWEDGLSAAKEAVRLKPGDQLAKNNLQWAITRRNGGSR
jgi:tetratricopeptide (TPR) repeat protein